MTLHAIILGMASINCPACSHTFDVRLVTSAARAKAPSAVLAHASQEVSAFLRECSVAGPERLRAAEVYAAYLDWIPSSRRPLSRKAFGMGMRQNGVTWGRDKSGTSYSGLRLL